jgi:hypothetical protein
MLACVAVLGVLLLPFVRDADAQDQRGKTLKRVQA